MKHRKGGRFWRNARQQHAPPLVSLTVSVLMVSMVAIVAIHAQPSFAIFYDDIVGGGNRRSGTTGAAIKSSLDRCLDCAHWKSCWWGSVHVPIPPAVVYTEKLWEGLVAFSATFEVLVRGFTLGSGIRMLTYLFIEDDDRQSSAFQRSFRRKALVSIIAGLSLAAFLHGSSIFVPAEVRKEWFSDHHHHHPSNGIAERTTSLPLVLYDYIKEDLVQGHRTSNTLDCPSNCKGEFCNPVFSTIHLDWTAYFLERVGTGLSYLTTTLEILLRGFSLGFGALMLKFLFRSGDGSSNNNNNSSSSAAENEATAPTNSSSNINKQDISYSQSVNKEMDNDDDDDLFESFRQQAIVSAISGVSVAAVVHGSSVFVPVRVREQWFVHGIDTEEIIPYVGPASLVIVAIFFAQDYFRSQKNSKKLVRSISDKSPSYFSLTFFALSLILCLFALLIYCIIKPILELFPWLY